MGCDAGFLNASRIKGSHAAIKTGMLAAEAAFDALGTGRAHDELRTYADTFNESWLHDELYRARNFKPAMGKGLWLGTLLVGIDQKLFGGKAPWTMHTTKPDLRADLLPRAPALSPAELVDLGEAYAQATGYPIQYQWTPLQGVNDGDDELEGIATLLSGKRAMMNLIPFNAWPGSGFECSDDARIEAFAQILANAGYTTPIRRPRVRAARCRIVRPVRPASRSPS